MYRGNTTIYNNMDEPQNNHAKYTQRLMDMMDMNKRLVFTRGYYEKMAMAALGGCDFLSESTVKALGMYFN